MSSEQSADKPSQKTAPQSPITTDTSTATTYQQSSTGTRPLHIPSTPSIENAPENAPDRKQAATHLDHTSKTTSPSTPEDPRNRPRQVIAVSASKGPAAFFNLARKFLITDDSCDLSALEGAIVSATDAAHLLERSQLATIVRVQTSYVAVEPKRRRQDSRVAESGDVAALSTPAASAEIPRGREFIQEPSTSSRELRRARIVITVKRTESYRQWLLDNPLQSVMAGDDDDDDGNGVDEEEAVGAPTRQNR